MSIVNCFAVARSVVCRTILKQSLVSLSTTCTRNILLTPSLSVKEIKLTQEGDVTLIEAEIKESKRKGKVLNGYGPNHACPLCKFNLKLRHTDVLILSQFTSTDGSVLPTSVTGLCKKQHKEIVRLVDEAKKAGLLPGFYMEAFGKYNPRRRWKWEKLNTYFETPEEIKWKEMVEKDKRWYEKPPRKIWKLQDIL